MGISQKKTKTIQLWFNKIVVDSGALSIANKNEKHNYSQSKNLGATQELHLKVINRNHN